MKWRHQLAINDKHIMRLHMTMEFSTMIGINLQSLFAHMIKLIFDNLEKLVFL